VACKKWTLVAQSHQIASQDMAIYLQIWLARSYTSALGPSDAPRSNRPLLAELFQVDPPKVQTPSQRRSPCCLAGGGIGIRKISKPTFFPSLSVPGLRSLFSNPFLTVSYY
jgi:hypothetical protein